jgi:hypothetical protein
MRCLQSSYVDVSNKKRRALAATLPPLRCGGQGSKLLDQLSSLAESFTVQGVVHPPALPAIRYQPSVLEHLEMKREPRLSGVERVGELTDAALATPKALEDPESGLVGKSVEEASSAGWVNAGSGSHNCNISMIVDMSRKPARSDGSA